MFCANCGKKLESDSKFCPYCGQKVMQTREHENVSTQLELKKDFGGTVKELNSIIPEESYSVKQETATEAAPSKQHMIQYIKTAIQIEQDIYTMQEITERIQEEINELAIKRPVEGPSSLEDPILSDWPFFAKLYLASLLCAPISFFSVGITGYFGVVLFFISVAIIILGFFRFLFICSDRSKEKKRIEELKQVNQDYAKRHRDAVEYEENRQKENRAKSEIIELQAADIYSRFEETKTIRERFYADNWIHPYYRNLPALCSFLEYFETGRCTTLESPDGGIGGAYNIYSQEMRANIIIGKLDEIGERLDAIQNNQAVLYRAISSANDSIAKITNSVYCIAMSLQAIKMQGENINSQLEQLNRHSETTAYLARQNQRQLEYMNFMNYHAQNYGDRYINTPPSL